MNINVHQEGISKNMTTTIKLIKFGGRKHQGALTGNPATSEATLRFSALSGISAMIETIPLECAAEDHAKVLSGKARFRMVLTMGALT
jgi:propanol-preferring alcohol dehydrogenase